MDKKIIQAYKRKMGEDIFDIAWYNLSHEQIYKIMNDSINPLSIGTYTNDDIAMNILRIMRMPEYLFWAAKVLFNVNLHPMQAIILQELWERPFPMLIASRGASKSYLMALYIMLKMRLIPGTKIVACGAAFRQSRLIFEQCEKFFKESDVLRSTLVSGDGPRTSVDRCIFNMGNSVAYFIPIGCVTRDTLISTNKGLKSITGVGSSIDLYNPIKCSDGQEIAKFYSNGKKKILEITTERGYNIILTYDQQVYTLNRGMVKAMYLDVNDDIYIDCKKREWAGEHNFSDMMMRHLAKRLALVRKDHTIRPLRGFPDDHACARPRNFQLADSFFGNSSDNIKKFLSYFFSYNTEISQCSSITKFKSIKLAQQIQTLLLSFGIMSSLKINPREKKKHRSATLHISKNYFEEMYEVTKKVFYRIYKPKIKIVENSDKIYKKKNHNNKKYVFDVYVPEGNEYIGNGFKLHNSGDTIRGLRATTIICDEFSSINPDIYETVISAFSSVNKDPIASMRASAKRQEMIRMGLWTAQMEQQYSPDINQSILAGTCGYDFEHFARYWRMYKSILNTKGDPEKLEELGVSPNGWMNYSIMRIPYELMPSDFMNEESVNRNKLSMTKDAFMREYGAVFTKDSEGFFKKSLLESSTASPKNSIIDYSTKEPIVFAGRIKGDPNLQYIMGIDVASEKDNFAVVLLEMHQNHNRVVYSWAFNRKKHAERIKAKVIKEMDFFQYCVSKIRSIMGDFNVTRILMDSQGGGRTIQQALSSPRDKDDIPIYEIIEEGKEKITDDLPGLHIVEMCHFANVRWISEANHGMKFDLENKLLLFPDFDNIILAVSYEEDYNNIKNINPEITHDMMSMYDTLEDCMLDIQAMKDELSTIVVTKSATGVERFSTPEVQEGRKKKYLRKDRYSALLMANMGARGTGKINITSPKNVNYGIGVGMGMTNKNKKSNSMYTTGTKSVNYKPRAITRKI
jgi:hypothetical protein